MLRKIQYSYFENKYLKELRDSLLPRLISGKLIFRILTFKPLNYCLALKYDLYSMGGWNCF